MPSSLHGQKGVECAGMAKHVEMRECWWRHLSGGRLVEGSNAHIATEDIGDFQSTTLQDVQNAAQAIERRQSQRQSLQNLRRIQPFLEFMQRYAGVLEVICQGYSPIAWVWVSKANPGYAPYRLRLKCIYLRVL